MQVLPLICSVSSPTHDGVFIPLESDKFDTLFKQQTEGLSTADLKAAQKIAEPVVEKLLASRYVEHLFCTCCLMICIKLNSKRT